MRATIRVALALLAVTTSFSATPAQATAWQNIGSGHISIIGTSHVAKLLDMATNSLGAAACVPKERVVETYNLAWDTWFNTASGEIAYNWHGTAGANASADCSNKVRVTVQVSDYAPLGRPPVVRGNPESVDGPSGTTVSATGHAWVPYYVPLSLYQRGQSLVEVRAVGAYRNGRGVWVSFGCRSVFVPVTPTPFGPVTGEPYEQTCPPL